MGISYPPNLVHIFKLQLGASIPCLVGRLVGLQPKIGNIFSCRVFKTKHVYKSVWTVLKP